ncbi:MAG: hypothetical protein A2020_07305 [Lentisphaerae bacterium GWF2_45_14]|nr:MAG: hypothetical protein A2020_07305 [Lentisphaerae bacterium GWF2_45_14]
MAKIVQSSCQERAPLADILPLEQPFAVHVFPAYFCNFKCFYCIHSLSEPDFSELGHKKQLMSFDTFKHAVDGCALFTEKLKVMSFAGHGEPLINQELSQMIAYARDKGIAGKLELVTNGYLLSNETSLALVDAGLDNIRISVQGLSSEKYRKVAGVDVDFEKFRSQLEFFYKHKEQCNIYIKIVDSALEKDEDKRFYELFDGICDRIAIEHIVPTAHGVDYEKHGTVFDKTQQGYEHRRIKVCPMPFYAMIVEPDGNVRTCCATKFPVLLGNVNQESLPGIWKSTKLRDFQEMLLKGERFRHPVCGECTNPDYGLQPGDLLDEKAADILTKIEKENSTK